MVEMAFVLPVLLVVLFGIIEFGYLIFTYSTVSQAVRNAAEAGAQLPPYQSWLAYQGQSIPGGLTFRSDECVNGIYSAAETDATLFSENIATDLTISYPKDGTTIEGVLVPDTRNLKYRGPIEITIRFDAEGITPLFSLLGIGDDGTIEMTVTQRRSLENLGEDPSKPGGVACAQNAADWQKLHPEP